MSRIPMTTPIVEMDGDEMTRIIWRMIKDELISPYVDLKTEYYDLGLPHRDATDDAVTHEAAAAAKRLGVAVKCATITPNVQRVEEYHLKRMYPSPNATIRAAMDGTVFRAPIIMKGIEPLVPRWKAPITVARHAYGDIYKGVEFRMPGPGTVTMVMKTQSGEETALIHEYEGEGIALGMHNTTASIESFAKACFSYALSVRQDLWFAAKDTILKNYDGEFRAIFAHIFEAEYRERFAAAGIRYEYTLIDDAVARVMRSQGGFIWACKNYDGDVMSDMIATAFGSLAMMTSVLVSPDGCFEYEAAHGTVTRHYYRHLKGEVTSTNPVATIFAWTGALKKRGELDDNRMLSAFGQKLEDAVMATLESGRMTGDLAGSCALENITVLSTERFIAAIKNTLESM